MKKNFIWWTLLIAALANFIIAIDTFFLTVAITTLVRELNTTVQVIQATIAGYSLARPCSCSALNFKTYWGASGPFCMERLRSE